MLIRQRNEVLCRWPLLPVFLFPSFSVWDRELVQASHILYYDLYTQVESLREKFVAGYT